MAEENQDGQEKTEEPSQRKIDKHKEDGKVLSSKEMFVFELSFHLRAIFKDQGLGFNYGSFQGQAKAKGGVGWRWVRAF